jgi:hypothetical protein
MKPAFSSSIPNTKVILDRSAFHGNNFTKLADSKLLELTQRNIIRVHHTNIFLEETMGLYQKESNRKIFNLQLPFILNICNGKWFHAREEMWDAALLKDGRKRANVYVPDEERRNTEEVLRNHLSNNTEILELTNGFSAKRVEREKQEAQLKFFQSMRDDVAKLRTSIKSSANRIPPTARDFIRIHLNNVGFELIRRIDKITDPHSVYRKWRLNKKHYPMFTAFAEGYLYSAYYAMVEAGIAQGKKIDRNSQADIEQLTYLSKADLLVSCDQKFMFDAFNVLWANKGKRFMTTDEFVTYLTTIDCNP